MTVECVSIDTNHYFVENPIHAQHQLRYRSIIERQGWEVHQFRGMEYDEYDTPATIYLIYRDKDYIARGVTRFCSTQRPYMLADKFSYCVNKCKLPESPVILEGSRFCVDHTLDLQARKRITHELILAYLEYGIQYGIERIVGLMYPVYWRNLFSNNGWEPQWMGDIHRLPEGHRIRAGYVEISNNALRIVRNNMGIHAPVLSYGLEGGVHDERNVA